MRKLLALVLLFAAPAFGRARASGYCEQGGQVVLTNNFPSSTKVQQSYPACTLTVYYTYGAQGTVTTNGTAVTATSGPAFGNWSGLSILINNIPYTVASVTDTTHLTLTASAGPQINVPYVAATPTPAPVYSDNNGTPMSNSFTASATGYWFFYADNGTYDVRASGAGIPVPFTWGAISIFDPLAVPTFPGIIVKGPTTLNGPVTASGPSTFNGSTTFTGPLTGANLLSISASRPVYLYAHFRDDDTTHLRISYSRDAVNYADVNTTGVFSAAATRDPSIMYVPNATAGQPGTFYVLLTPSAGCQVQFIKSQDLLNWTVNTPINMSNYDGSCQTSWAPEWWADPNGNYYFFVSLGHVANPGYNSPKTPWLVQMNLTTGTPFTGTALTLNGTTQSNTFDYFPYLVNGTYYLLYVDQQNSPTVTQPIAFATASSLTGTYTQQTTAGADYYGFGTFQTEAPTLISLGTTGCVRIMVDEWTYPQGNNPPENIGRAYTQAYRDSCASAGGLFTSSSLVNGPNPIAISGSEHGTVIPISNSFAASPIYNAAAQNYASNNVATNWCVGVAPCPFPLTVTVPQSFAAGVTGQPPPTLGFGFSGNWATLTAIHQAAQQAWPPAYPSASALSDTRISPGYSGSGAFGAWWNINYQTGGAEASSLDCDGCWGLTVPPTSTEGNAAIWTHGENNGASALGPHNHRWALYNAALTNSIYIPTGTVNTAGTVVTLVSGPSGGFTALGGPVAGTVLLINNAKYTVTGIPTSTTLSLTTSAGTQTGVGYSQIDSGGLPLQVDPNTGEAHLNYSATFGAGANTAYGYTNFASLYTLNNVPNTLNLDTGVLPLTAVNTSGSTISWVSGPQFSVTSGQYVLVNGTQYTATGTPTATSITTTTSIGTNWGVQFATLPQGTLRLGAIQLTPTKFANLGAPGAGTEIWCPDCQIATPCVGSGSGAWAFRTATQWTCQFSSGGGGGSVTAATVSQTFAGNQTLTYTHGLNAVDGSSNPIAPTMTCTDVTLGVQVLPNAVTVLSANAVAITYSGSPSNTLSVHFVF